MGVRHDSVARPAGRATRPLVVLLVIWLVGTATLLAVSFVVGFNPSTAPLAAARVHASGWFLVAAVGCALVVPAIGTLVALNAERYGTVVAFLAAGALALAAGAGAGVLTPGGVHSLYRTVASHGPGAQSPGATGG